MLTPLRLPLCALLLMVVLCSPLARAGGISVAPVRLEMAATQRSVSLTVRNEADESQVLQLTPMQWHQQQGEDRYEPDTQLIVTPPLFELAPGESQVVRIGPRDGHGASEQERAWRLYLEPVSVGAATPGQVRLQLRIGVPLFIAPRQSHRELLWQLRQQHDSTQLQAANTGNVHIRLDRVALTAPMGEARTINGPIYLFPGQQRTLLRQDGVLAAARLQEDSDAGSRSLSLDATAQ